MHSVMRSATSPRIKTEALIPQCSRVGDLRRRAPKEYRREVRNAADVAQRLQKQSNRLPAARRTAINADIGGGSKKLSLRSRLCRDYAFWRWRHLSRLSTVYALLVEGGARPDTMVRGRFGLHASSFPLGLGHGSRYSAGRRPPWLSSPGEVFVLRAAQNLCQLRISAVVGQNQDHV